MTNNKCYKTAIHEAAHIIAALVGYSYNGISTKYNEKSEEEIPIKVTIKGNNDYYGYSELIPDTINEILNIQSAPEKRHGWHIFRLLAGYAAEEVIIPVDYDNEYSVNIFDLSCLWVNHSIGTSAHDFCKVRDILDQLIDDNVYMREEKMLSAFKSYWAITVDAFENESLKVATKNLAKELLEKLTLKEVEIKELKNKNFDSQGLDEYIVFLPHLFSDFLSLYEI